MFKKFLNKFGSLSENNKIIVKNVIGAFAVKGMSLVVSLFTMPAYLRFFNNESALGLWFTILSVLNWILNFDLGIGNGLRNSLAKAITENKTDEAKKYISSAYVSVGVLCVVISAAFIAIFDFINWNSVFNIKSSVVSPEALLLTVKIVFVGIVLQLFFKLISSVLYALQMSSINNFLSLCTSIINIIAVSVLPSGSNDKNMVVMAIVHTFSVIFPLLFATVLIFSGKRLRKCIPRFRYFSFKHAKVVLTLGGMFLFVQLAYMVIMSTNEYLITLFYENSAVVDYQIYYKLFSLGATIFSLALTPVWSAVTKALAEKNYKWIRGIYKKMLLLSFVGGILELMIIPFLQIFVNIWLGESAISINIIYALAFAILCTLMIVNSVMSSIANGIAELKTQAVCFAVGAILKIPLAWLLVKATGSWIGVVWANAVVLCIYCIIQPITINKSLKKNEVS